MKTAILIPTHDKFSYVYDCLRSLVKHTVDYLAIVIDDGSYHWSPEVEATIRSIVPKDNLILEHYDGGGGELTRSWNRACVLAKENGCKYTVIANDDILFSPFWWESIESALEVVDLVGPVTNAPGGEHYDNQRIQCYLKDYVVSDEETSILNTAMQMQSYKGQIYETRVNGFFFAAKTHVLFNSCFKDEVVFDPANKFLGAEDEFMDRFPGKIGVALSSFIFHYRSVSRNVKDVPTEFLRGMYRKRKEFEGKIVVYSAIFNDWDMPHFKFVPDTADYVLFTDREYDLPNVDVRVVKGDARKSARYYKVNPHEVLPEYSAWIWLDGNMQLQADPKQIIEEMFVNEDIGSFKHPLRCCAYQEARIVKKMKLAPPDLVDEQMKQYVKEGFPVAHGLWETGVMVRKNTPKNISFNKLWWEQIEKYTLRDQLSVMYALWKNDMRQVNISGCNVHNMITRIFPHRKVTIENIIKYG